MTPAQTMIPAKGDIATDVAHGYSELLGKFEAVYGNPGMTTGGTARALTTAQKALTDAIEAGLTGASLTPLEAAVTRAQETHDKARAAGLQMLPPVRFTRPVWRSGWRSPS